MTSEEKKYLENKHRGGINNANGASYELYYVVKEILRWLVLHSDNLSNLYMIPQKKSVYVDDLVEYEPNAITYCQLKNVKNLRWTNRNKNKTIAEDFECQSKMCIGNGEKYTLKLVYSDLTSAVSTVPSNIASYTSTEFFDNYSSIEQMVLSERDLVDSFKKTYPQFDTIDKVSNYAVTVCGIWAGCDRSNKNVKVEDLLKEVESKGLGFTVIRTTAVSLPAEVEAVLNGIEGIEYGISANILQVHCNGIKSEIPITDELIRKIVDAKPTDIFNLIQILF